jgi:hypothetical protein
MIDDLARHLAEEGLLALEVVEEGGGCDVGRGGDLLDGGRVDPLLLEQAPGGRIDARPQLPFPALASTLGGHYGAHGMQS